MKSLGKNIHHDAGKSFVIASFDSSAIFGVKGAYFLFLMPELFERYMSNVPM